MTYDEFSEIVRYTMATVYHPGTKNEWICWTNGNEDRYEVKWSTGGMSGGSCWGDSPSYCGGDEPKEVDLTPLLEAACPNITFLQYRKMLNELEEKHTDVDYEYYGNCTNYAIRSVNYRKLYDYLVEKELIKE